MTIYRALQKINVLTKEELKHCIQLMDIEIKNYDRCVKNYPTNKMKRFGIPHQQKLLKQQQIFVNRLNEL